MTSPFPPPTLPHFSTLSQLSQPALADTARHDEAFRLTHLFASNLHKDSHTYVVRPLRRHRPLPDPYTSADTHTRKHTR